jgi:predicted membrane-bound spermidine synthase
MASVICFFVICYDSNAMTFSNYFSNFLIVSVVFLCLDFGVQFSYSFSKNCPRVTWECLIFFRSSTNFWEALIWSLPDPNSFWSSRMLKTAFWNGLRNPKIAFAAVVVDSINFSSFQCHWEIYCSICSIIHTYTVMQDHWCQESVWICTYLRLCIRHHIKKDVNCLYLNTDMLHLKW